MTNRDLAIMISEMARLSMALRAPVGDEPPEDRTIICKVQALQNASNEVAKWHNQLVTVVSNEQIMFDDTPVNPVDVDDITS